MAVEFGWPCGEPLCKSLSGYPGLWEVRSNIKSGIARVFFYIDKSEMILLHGLVKKTQNISKTDMAKRLKTSRSQLDRLLDPDNETITLQTASRAAAVLGMTLEINLSPM